MILYRFADSDMKGPTSWHSYCDPKPRLADGILMSMPLRSLIQAAVYDIPCPQGDRDIGPKFQSGRHVCACTPRQFECAARVVDGEEFLMPPILWTLDVPNKATHIGDQQAIIDMKAFD